MANQTESTLPAAASLRPLLAPESVAVVGASRDPAAIGRRVLDGMVAAGFRGAIYPVNPNADSIQGLRCSPSAAAAPAAPELAVIAVPSHAVLAAVDDCARAGVKALVVITAGFAEAGPAGAALERELLAKIRAAGMRMVGPNCLGLLNAVDRVRLNASFSPIFPPAGRLAMSSQSGALGLAVLASAHSLGLGLSQFVSVGNQADVSSNDLIEWWASDPDTDVLLLYSESFGSGRRFARLARSVSRTKPIIALKSGRSAAGAKAASSHTAALAASDTAIDALLRQTGVIRAETMEEMFDLARLAASQPLPRGRRVAVVTNAGGPAILCADACEAAGLSLPELSAKLQAELAALLPAAASVRNPVDMIASAAAAQYRGVVEALLRSGEADALVAIYIPAGIANLAEVARATQEAKAAAEASGAPRIPLVAVWMAGDETDSASDAAIPRFLFPEPAARALGKLAEHQAWLDQPAGAFTVPSGMRLADARALCRRVLAARGPDWLAADEIRELLAHAGLPQAPGGMARTADEAAALAARVGCPVAVKLASRRILHKTEAGGVRLNLRDEAAVRDAFAIIRAALADRGQADAMDGVVVQPMFATGAELMAGMVQDRLLGPLIAFGLGGIHVEILRDVCFRVTPLTDVDAKHLVRGIRGFRLLEGYRGHPPADLPAIEDLLLRLSQLVDAAPELQELDFNPILALPPGQGCVILDARVRLAEPLPLG